MQKLMLIRKNAQLYNDLLENVKSVITPTEADYARHVYHVYAIRVQKRDALISTLAKKDIHCGIHYPIPIHLQNAYKFLDKGIASLKAHQAYIQNLAGDFDPEAFLRSNAASAGKRFGCRYAVGLEVITI